MFKSPELTTDAMVWRFIHIFFIKQLHDKENEFVFPGKNWGISKAVCSFLRTLWAQVLFL